MDDAHALAAADSMARDDVLTESDEEKLAELLLLAAEELLEDRFAGAIKLNKVLFFAEFAHMRLTGRPITGTPYQKLRLGPAPRRLVPLRDRLIAAGDATLEQETVLGRVQHRLRPARPVRRDIFSDTELTAVADAVALLRVRTGTDVSTLSHQEPGWQLVADGDVIPYVTTYLTPDQTRSTPAIRDRAAKIATDYAARIYPDP